MLLPFPTWLLGKPPEEVGDWSVMFTTVCPAPGTGPSTQKLPNKLF